MRLQRWFGPEATRGLHLAAFGLIALLACGLYLPFLRNPLVFDDRFFFAQNLFSYYATHPLGLVTRAPAYFSLAFTEVLFSRIEAHRLVSLLFHVGCAFALYRLLYLLLQGSRNGVATAADGGSSRAALCAAIAATGFAIHPAAVYGAAYLVQRSIVLATLFSLLSLLFLVRGLRRGAYADAVWAGFLYALAVLCKEHSMLLPAVAVPLAMLANPGTAFALRYVALYLAACAPAALFVLVLMLGKQLFGQAYEPHLVEIAGQIEASSGSGSVDLSWPLSAVTQAGLFFRYLAIWLWPDTSAMAIDLRIDPLASWSPAWVVIKVAGFAAAGVCGLLLVRRRANVGLIGLGMLYVWILFLPELSVLRFQEPFVLYRSYLWAPGIAIAVAAIFSYLDSRVALAAFALTCPALLFQAHDRLVSFSTPLRLWEDAAGKLAHGPLPWGSRVLYEVGREYLYSGQPDKAIAAAERCMATYPGTWQCVYARGAIHTQLEQYDRALAYFVRAADMQPASGIAQHRVGLVLEKLDRIEEAKQRYRKAASLGYRGADLELGRLGAATGVADAPMKP